jgi:serine/threonine protein phosphatase PrpC
MPFSLGLKTDIGRKRQHNEDALGYFDTPNGHLLVVCDGMGGHAEGALAAQIAIKEIAACVENGNANTPPPELLEKAIEAANKAILNQASKNSETKRMGTTCVAVLVKGSQVYYAHVGDSRLYLYSQKQLTRITRDHSVVQLFADIGVLTQDEADFHPRSNEILRALGMPNLMVEVGETTITLQDQDVLLLCSDGLTGMLHDNAIAEILAVPESLQSKATKLIDAANMAGGDDNISVQLLGWNWLYINEVQSQEKFSTPIYDTYKRPPLPPRNYKKIVAGLLMFLFVGVLAAAVFWYLHGIENAPNNARTDVATTEDTVEFLPLPAAKTENVFGERYPIYWRVLRSNETLDSIAVQYNATKALLLRYNPQIAGKDTVGHAPLQIKVPVRAVHIVLKGHIMDTIEKIYSIDRHLVMRANKKRKPKVLVGDTVVIPMGYK